MQNNRQKIKLIILLHSFVEVTIYNIYTTAPIKQQQTIIKVMVKVHPQS